ncbi:MAG: phosphoribosylglycinamide formyltransferase [Pseudomonadota bacterium]
MTSRNRAKLAILISGRGSNLQAFIDASTSGDLDGDIELVISNNPDAEGLEKAKRAGISRRCVDHRQYADREAFDTAILALLRERDIDIVILAGFMRILTATFIAPFHGRLLNVHPSLLPHYPGLDTHQRALDAGDKEAGVTVHFVTLELDGGPPIIQARVPILPGDTATSLSERVLLKEHEIYPLATQWLIEGRLNLTETGAFLDGERLPATGQDYLSQTD